MADWTGSETNKRRTSKQASEVIILRGMVEHWVGQTNRVSVLVVIAG